MSEPASIADIRALADALPRGYRDRGNGETMQATFVLDYDAGDEMWEIEWCCLDGARNFCLRERLLSDLLDRAKARVFGEPSPSARDLAIEAWGEDPQIWPGWNCSSCQQRNSGWTTECGRCEQKRDVRAELP